MPSIDILLAAYNGEKYIAEQIDSILAQTFQDFRLIIRDDGSTDNTPAIIADYARRYPGKIEVVHDDVVCRGATRNFFQLLTYARADYVMFSDQDDVWLPHKIQLTLDYMKSTERENPGKPALVFTGLELVDEQLRFMDKFMNYDLRRFRYEFDTILLSYNVASGCTQMINRKVYESLGSFTKLIDFHDRWIMLFTSACGVVRHIPAATILYRQHGDNNVGWDKFAGGGGGGFRRITNILKSPLNKFFTAKKNYTITPEIYILFRERYSSMMPEDKLQQLNNYIEFFSKNKFARFRALFKSDFFAKNDMAANFLCVIRMLIF